MMESRDASWKVHLIGARHIFDSMFCSGMAEHERFVVGEVVTEAAHPIRRFLISLMSYLDVAGACATGNGSLLRETIGNDLVEAGNTISGCRLTYQYQARPTGRWHKYGFPGHE